MLSLLALCLAADQPITVVNKCPSPIIVVVKTVAPEVAPARARTFRNGDFHGSHSCPQCGRQQFVIHSGAKGRVHYHQCSDPNCRTLWQH